MKKMLSILFILMTFTAAACKDSVMEMNNPDKSGADLNLTEIENEIIFDDLDQNSLYTDFQGVDYPLNEYGLLTCQALNTGEFVPGEMPAILHAFEAPNYGSDTIKSYNTSYEYTAKFRITDDTFVAVDGFDSVNEPQGIILTSIFLAGEEVHGALMLMIFRTDAFPITGTLFQNPNIHENVVLALNYDGVSSGHVMAVARVEGITAIDASVDPHNEEETEAARGIHTATLRIHDDADETHGPSISVIINGNEVIKYQNTGTAHSLATGSWDSETSLITGDVMGIARTVLEIDPSIEAYKFSNSDGINTYNEAWSTAIWRPYPTGNVTSLITSGIMFQIGKKESNAGTGGSGAPGSSKFKSPEVLSIDVKPYTTPIE